MHFVHYTACMYTVLGTLVTILIISGTLTTVTIDCNDTPNFTMIRSFSLATGRAYLLYFLSLNISEISLSSSKLHQVSVYGYSGNGVVAKGRPEKELKARGRLVIWFVRVWSIRTFIARGYGRRERSPERVAGRRGRKGTDYEVGRVGIFNYLGKGCSRR